MIYKGTVITVDKENSVKKYLVEENGKIVFTGDVLPEKYAGLEVVDLKDGALMPAFADTHGHFASFAMFQSAVKLDKAADIGEMLEILKEADAKTPKRKGFFCFGATPYVADGRLINKRDIDAVLSHRAVVIICGDGHTAVLNEKAMSKMPVELFGINGCDRASGIMRHESFYKVADNVLKVVSPLDGIKAMQGAFDEYAKQGFGLIAAECGTGMPADLDVDLLKWIYRGRKNGPQMRFFIQSFDVTKAVKRNIPRLGGCFATALDGSVSSNDAAMTEPYNGTGNRGILYYSDAELYEKVKTVHNAGLSLQLHAIGDAAVLQAARTFKRVLDEFPQSDCRHGIIHATLVPDEAMDIIEKYNIQILGQPAFIEADNKFKDALIQKLGKERYYAAEPHAEFVKRGIMFSAGSDCPVSFPDGIKSLYWLLNNPIEKHRVGLDDAIRICTYNGYYSTFDEKERGSLERGKTADMIILNKNPYALPAEKLDGLKVISAIYNGIEYRPSKTGIFAAVLKGMFNKNAAL